MSDHSAARFGAIFTSGNLVLDLTDRPADRSALRCGCRTPRGDALIGQSNDDESRRLLGSELRPSVGLQETARRAPVGADRDDLFLRDLRVLPEGLFRRPLNPGADFAQGSIKFENKPL